MFKNKPPLADGQSIDTLIGPQVTLHGDLVFSGVASQVQRSNRANTRQP